MVRPKYGLTRRDRFRHWLTRMVCRVIGHQPRRYFDTSSYDIGVRCDRCGEG